MADRWRVALGLALALCSAGAAHARDPATNAMLVRAIRADDAAGVQSALAAKADANQTLAFGATPLAYAAHAQNPAVVAALIAAGAKVDGIDDDGQTPLALACELGDAQIVDHLLAARAPVRIGPDGASELSICARFGSAQGVARMLAAGVPADRADSRGQTALMWAAAAGRTEAMGLLIKAGADVNRVSAAGFTPLFFAIKSGVVGATALLLDAGADAGHRGPESTSASQLAVYQNNTAAAALLAARFAKGAPELAERGRTGEQLLHAAAHAGDLALIEVLLAKGADVNALTGPSKITWVTEANFGRPPPPVPPTPPLLLAAAAGHEAVMRKLVEAGADRAFVGENGTNVLLAAAQGGSAAALGYALELAPDVNLARADGATALHLLIGGGVTPEFTAMIRLLASHGARTDIKASFGMTAAEMALGGLNDVKAIFLETFPSTRRAQVSR